jgi:ATP-dependent helicase Lhr and Lhr-like helicase
VASTAVAVHPLPVEFSVPVRAWFERRFGGATEPQALGWPAIASGEDTLIAAPTGSGKTLAAFLIVIDTLVRRALEGRLADELECVYVSPLRALSHDIQANLETPLAEIRAEAERLGLALPEIRVAVRTGDTPPSERQAMLRRAPHILVTTPESLYLILTGERSRALLASVHTLIVDEIHALARDKRGSHLALSLERLEAVARQRPLRIGLSATQRPLETIARFLIGSRRRRADGSARCTILDLGHQRELDLAVQVPPGDDLAAVASNEQWDDMLALLASAIEAHRTTLIFVNTRRLAERLAHRLAERPDAPAVAVAAHHGSLSRERRLRVETDLREGRLRAIVATASLELGIDIGYVDLVVQIGSPRSIATFLQRVGRSGHALGLVPKGRLLPTTRDELAECAALVRAVRAGRLDAIHPPLAPLDILAQQIVAACACEEWSQDALFELVRGAEPYAALSRADFDAVVEMLAQGFETPRGRRAQHLHHDRLEGRLRARRGARLTAIMSGGAIADTGDYRVLLHPSDTFVGTVGEDFAIESSRGDVFLLGTHSWRVHRVESDVLRVTDAEGAPPTVPFWVGEAPARTEELSSELSALRAQLAADLGAASTAPASEPEPSEGGSRRAVPAPGPTGWLREQCGLCESGARQLSDYIGAELASLGRVPTREDIVAERFFDESGGMQLVLHSPYGARINRAITLALRKRFCRSFNQELQAAATDDAAVLSLSAAQSFPIEDLKGFLRSDSLEEVLEQAVLATPMFAARWRWNAARALAVARNRGGGRVPFALQRMQSDDLLAAVFPEQTACQEHQTYPIELPDHPLVHQTLADCLSEACDLGGARRLLEGIESGAVRFHGVDTVEPSPFAHEIINARPYAFLDDAPLEERRTRAVALRRVLPEHARDLGRLEPEAIARVREEVAPAPRSADELYELLLDVVVLDEARARPHAPLADALVGAGRAARVRPTEGRELLFALECLPQIEQLYAGAPHDPPLALPAHLASSCAALEVALDRAVRGHLALAGPLTPASLAARLCVAELDVEASLARAEGRGIALRGVFDPELSTPQFCDRGLLARIHRYTIARLRREVEAVSAQQFGRFLLRWQHLEPETRVRGEGGLLEVVSRLSGFEAPAAAWEPHLLASRVERYTSSLLDAVCLSGAVAWARLAPGSLEPGAQSSRATPIALVPRAELDALLHSAVSARGDAAPRMRGSAEQILELLERRGALFAAELERSRILLPSQIEEGLRELVAHGRITCDGFAPLRRLLAAGPRVRRGAQRMPRVLARGIPVPEGRWSLLEPLGPEPTLEERAEATARRLLQRYGVVFRDLLPREWLPESWREVHRALRRLEARGEVRGGRFVTGFVGEQFALPEAVALLRRERARTSPSELRVSAADPLNLVGILTPGPRVPAGHRRWILYKDGLPVAEIESGRRTPLPVPSTLSSAG